MESIGFDCSQYSIYGANIYLNIVNRNTGEIVEICHERGKIKCVGTGQFKKEKTEKKSRSKNLPDNVIPFKRARA